MKNLQIYECSDLYFAGYLRACYNFPIINTLRDPSSPRVTFIFQIGDHNIQKIIQEFYNGQGTVSVRDFCRELGSLKSLIHMKGIKYEK